MTSRGAERSREPGGGGSTANTSSPAAAKPARFQGVAQGVLVQERATRAVDHDRAVGEQGEFPGAEQTARLGCQPRVQRDDGGPAQQLVQTGDGCAHLAQGVRVGVGVVHQDVRAEGGQGPRHPAADRAAADQSDGRAA